MTSLNGALGVYSLRNFVPNCGRRVAEHATTSITNRGTRLEVIVEDSS